MKKYFITGTDTGVGKTTFTVAWLNQLRKQGKNTIALKPIATGCEVNSNNEWVSEDALALQQAMTVSLPYDVINPFRFLPPISAYIAAKQQNMNLSVASLVEACQGLFNYDADILLVEGAGGWMHPLNNNETLADFVVACQLEVILVVGMRLGCNNHALMTEALIKQRNLKLVGWVANCIEPMMLCLDENIQLLQQLIKVPLLTTLSYNQFSMKQNLLSKL